MLFCTSQTTLNDTNKPLPNLDLVPYRTEPINIFGEDVKDCLYNLKINKASGPDLISPRLLKEGAIVLARPFSVIFNRSLQQGYFPSDWKTASVLPIHKKEEKSLPSNYRPISLLSSPGKVMERCVHKHLYNYVTSHQLLTPLQSGLSKATPQHINCYILTTHSMKPEMSGIGCSDNVLKWFASYLSGRRQRVVLNGQTSDWTLILAGVSQGSILGPLLFLLYINDIVKHIGCSIQLFPDITSLYIIVECPNAAARCLNADSQTISQRAEDWLVNFNANKTLSMIISRRTISPPHLPLFMNGTMLQELNSHKHLGLMLSSSCNWSDHIKNISEKGLVKIKPPTSS